MNLEEYGSNSLATSKINGNAKSRKPKAEAVVKTVLSLLITDFRVTASRVIDSSDTCPAVGRKESKFAPLEADACSNKPVI